MMDFPAEWAPSVHLKALPSQSRDDVFKMFPAWFSEGESPVRDAIADSMMLMMIRLASGLAELAASANPVYAEGDLLDFALAPMPRAQSETDYDFRRRALKAGSAVSPKEILEAVYAITSRFSSTYPEYFELSEDEIFFFAHDDNQPIGFYWHDTDPFTDDSRQYETRQNCKPRHGFWRGEFRDPTNTRRMQSWVGDDWMDAFAEAKAIIAIPAFPIPGNDLDSDMFLFENAESSAIDSYGQALFNLTTLGTYPDEGGHVYASDQDITQVVSEVQAMLVANGAFPATCEIMLDPHLPL